MRNGGKGGILYTIPGIPFRATLSRFKHSLKPYAHSTVKRYRFTQNNGIVPPPQPPTFDSYICIDVKYIPPLHGPYHCCFVNDDLRLGSGWENVKATSRAPNADRFPTPHGSEKVPHAPGVLAFAVVRPTTALQAWFPKCAKTYNQAATVQIGKRVLEPWRVYQNLKSATVALQCRLCQMVACAELKKLRVKAKENAAGAAIAAGTVRMCVRMFMSSRIMSVCVYVCACGCVLTNRT